MPRHQPLTTRTLRELIADKTRLRKDVRTGQCKYTINGRSSFYSAEFLVNAIARALKAQENGASEIMVRCRSDQQWINFPDMRPATGPAKKKPTRAQVEEAARQGR